MNIMYLCDDGYSWIAGVSMLSLLENNKHEGSIDIYVVSDHISDQNKKKLIELVKRYGRSIYFIEKPNLSSFIGKVEMHWWVENVFSRVFLGEVFKDYVDLKRLIYIDCDTLILGELSSLWNWELGGYICAGVREAMGYYHKKAIGLKREEEYFNAGMFLVDIEKWRNENIDQKAMRFIRKCHGKMEYADESVLNGVLKDRICVLPPKYNLTSLSIYLSVEEVNKYRKPYRHYSNDELQASLDDPRIIHFTSTFLDSRPWVVDSHHPYCEEWLKYKRMSPWYEKDLIHDTSKMSKRMASYALRLLSPKIRYSIAGFLHAYIKPLKYAIGN